MSSENGSHAFQRSSDPRYPLACQKCGKIEGFHPDPPEQPRAYRRMREYLELLAPGHKHDGD